MKFKELVAIMVEADLKLAEEEAKIKAASASSCFPWNRPPRSTSQATGGWRDPRRFVHFRSSDATMS